MFLCPLCTYKNHKIVTLIQHLKFKHHFSRHFSCRQIDCTRTFQNVYTFKRHLLLKHGENTDNSQNTEVIVYSNAVPIQNETCYLSKNCELIEPHSVLAFDTTSNSTETVLEDFKKNVSENALLFTSKLYSNYSFPRNIVQSVVQDVSQALSKPLDMLKNKIASLNIESQEIMEMCDILDNFFKHFNSEYLRLKHIRLTDIFIEPVSVIAGQIMNDKKSKGRPIAEITNCTYQYIPVPKTLQHFLQLPSVYDSISSYNLSDEYSNRIHNLVQGSLWKEIKLKYKDREVFPLLLYSDDFEIGNPLGSHAGVYKICGVYISLACLPPEFASLLENIFLVQLCFSNDIKYLGNERVFQYLLRDLQLLESEGLVIDTETGKKVYFSLVLILGDNLGIHSMLGLQQSFNSNYFCRFCRCTKEVTASSIEETEDSLRSVDTYENDQINQSYGIKELCIWNQLSNFHIYRNLSVDIMHDIFEGICRYDLGNILYQFIYIDKFFSLETLNSRLKFYNFNDKNRPPLISKSQVLQKHILLSAAEMNAFVKNLSILVGDLIPYDNQVWDLYLCLVEIIDITTSKEIIPADVDLLKTIIAEHHSLYIQLFGKLKPKHHFLVHYPRLLVKIGPVNNLSSIRFEAKHKQFKANANATTSRKNILYSLATKNQLNMFYRLLSKKGFEDNFQFGPEDTDFDLGSEKFNIFKSYVNSDISDHYLPVMWVKVGGIKYSFSLVVTIDFESILPVFGTIRSIIINESDKMIYFILNKMRTLKLNEHYHAYEVETQNILCCKEYTELFDIFPSVVQNTNQKMLILK